MAREEYIRIYRSDVGGATPSLTSGEIATNLIDGKFFIGGTNGSLITFTSNSYNVTSVNGLTGAVVSIATTGSNVFTGLNTFNVGIIAAGATFTGDIALQGVYDEGSQTTNKTTLTVVNPTANRTISLPDASGTVALTNATVASINGATGTVSITGDGSNITITQSGNTITIAGQAQQTTAVTGDGAAIIGRNNAFVTARVGAYGATGVASFDPRFFVVGSSGHVVLTGSYQVTGDTVQAGTFINIGTGKVINNIGVQTFNGATGAVSFTVPLATTSLTGTASFNPNRFQVSATGNVDLITAYQVTGDTVQAGSGIAIGTDKTITNIGVTGIGFGADTGLTGKINLTAGNGMNLTRSGNTLSYSVQNFEFVDSINITSKSIIGSNQFTITGGTGIHTRMSDSKDSISIYSNFATTDTTAGIAWFRDDQFIVRSSDARVGLAAAYQVTGDTIQAGSFINIGAGKTINNIGVQTFNSLTGSVSLTGDGSALFGYANNRIGARLGSYTLTGVASFDPLHFTVGGTGHVRSKGIITINTVAADENGNFEIGSATVVTGDGGAIQGKGGAFITARLATTGLTGVASFNSTRFSVSNGAVDLATAYQATGDIIQAGSFINIGAGKTINNIGVQTFNSLTGAVSLTGDSGAIYGIDNSKIGARIATNSLTGVASFSSAYFTVGDSGTVTIIEPSITVSDGYTGSVVIGTVGDAGGYRYLQITGDSSISVSLTRGNSPPNAAIPTLNIRSLGVQTFNSLTGAVSFTVPLATTSLTGTASFNPNRFQVSITGNVDLIAAYQVTGDTVQAGSFINIGTGKTINNIGVQTFNSLTGAVSLTGDGGAVVGKENNKLTVRVVTDNAMTGVASFDASHFTVGGTGHVRSKGIITINTVAADANGNFEIGSATVVTGDGGAIQGKGGAFITARLATTEATGVASFNDAQFSVNEYASVSLIYPYDPTYVAFENTTNVFTSRQYFTAGISADSIFVGSGITSIEIAYRPFQGDLSESPTSHSLIKSNDQGGLYLFSSGGTTASSITFTQSGLSLGHNGVGGLATVNIGLAAAVDGVEFGESTYGSQLRFAAFDSSNNAIFALKTPSTFGSGTVNLTLPSTSGTLSLVGSVVTSINGATGTVSITGDGGAVQGKENNKLTVRVVTDNAMTGVASFDASHFTVGGTGHVRSKGIITINTVAADANGNFEIGSATVVTGDGGAIQGKGGAFITARLATTGVTGVASFNSTRFSVSNGAVDLASAFQVTGDTVQAGSFINIGTGKTINNIGVQTFNGLTGAVSITGDGGAVQGKENNKITARLASTSLTGVAYFDSSAFIVTDGYVQLNGGGPGGACSDYTTKGSCEANGCVWCEGTQTCVQQFCNLFTAKNNGIGASANANGSLSYLYFDPGNLSAYTSDYSNKKTNYVLVYDESGTGISKARRATLENFFSENSALLKSSTTGQLSNAVKKTNALGTNTIELGVVLGSIAAGQEGLVKGASAFAYITQNTVKSINGATGDVMVVGDINGCTGAIVITGTTNEVVVTNSCPNITIGLPDNVSIPYLSGTGATFTQTVTATRFIGIVSGGDF